MADSAATDVSKMKVVELRKALKSRGLAHSGDKAELIARLQAALTQDSLDGSGDINLDSDEIDLDGVLDEDDKAESEVNEAIVESLNEELALADQPESRHAVESSRVAEKTANEQSMAVHQTIEQTAADQSPTQQSASTNTQGAATAEPKTGEKTHNETRSIKTLKRKISMSDAAKKVTDNKDGSKKIVLNRAISASSVVTNESAEKTEDKSDKSDVSGDSSKVKITADLDAKTKLEMRAKRFGLPVKMTDDQRKEARKQRFEQNAKIIKSSALSNTSGILNDNIDKLKQRAERFGQSVSKFMTDIENKEKLEKRKAKFATSK